MLRILALIALTAWGLVAWELGHASVWATLVSGPTPAQSVGGRPGFSCTYQLDSDGTLYTLWFPAERACLDRLLFN
jgi:hypothetical protein